MPCEARSPYRATGKHGSERTGSQRALCGCPPQAHHGPPTRCADTARPPSPNRCWMVNLGKIERSTSVVAIFPDEAAGTREHWGGVEGRSDTASTSWLTALRLRRASSTRPPCRGPLVLLILINWWGTSSIEDACHATFADLPRGRTGKAQTGVPHHVPRSFVGTSLRMAAHHPRQRRTGAAAQLECQFCWS